jgi:uroporphyrinogen-III synthase
MRNESLKNMRVLVTRPSPSGEKLCQLLAEHGAIPVHFPTIEIQSKQNDADFMKNLTNLGTQDWLIFISPQAVYTSIASIRNHWPHFPPTLKLAAIGAGTAEALKEAGYLVDAIPSIWNSEGLLSLSAFENIKNLQIMLVKGKGGREVLTQTLIKRGAIVNELIAYERKLPSILISFDISTIDAIIGSSYEAVHNLCSLIEEKKLTQLFNIPLLVPSERIKILARDLGFQTIWVTTNPSHHAFLMQLEEKRKNHG